MENTIVASRLSRTGLLPALSLFSLTLVSSHCTRAGMDAEAGTPGDGSRWDAAIGDCPGDMVPIPGQPACIDRYEATLYTNPDCSGLRYGANGADFPSGFPPSVESAGCSGTCGSRTTSPATMDLYACSVGGVRPTAWVTWFQAKRACENSGKHLCSSAERFDACAGNAGSTYPYGSTFVAGACNDASASLGAAALTGATTGCQGSAPGLFDLAGNLHEWLAGPPSDQYCNPAGGSFESLAASATCTSLFGENCGSQARSIGLRCCLAR